MSELLRGLSDLGTPSAVLMLLVGALVGVVVGVIPGLSGVVVLSVILVFAYHLNVTETLCLFIGAKCGGFYSASVSSILLNTPSHPEAVPITFDGYPMARKGLAGRALGISACSTCIGGIIGTVILFACMKFIDKLPGLFHPPEYVALVTLAMLLIGTLSTNSVGKSVAAAGGGLLLSSIGSSAITGTARFTFGYVNLSGGLALSALALGVFAIPQMVMIFGTGTATASQDISGNSVAPSPPIALEQGYGREFLIGVRETFRHWATLLQSGVVGSVIGMIPGIGGFAGNMMSYSIARTVSPRRDEFGTGIPEGIIAPEGSSLAKEAGHMVPLIGIGIPGGAVGALFIAVLSIKGMATGSGFEKANPGVLGQIVWLIALSGLIATIIGALLGSQIARVCKVPGPMIVPFIFAFSVSGAFLANGLFFEVVEMLVFGVVGLALRRLGYPLGCFILGLVLGPEFENNIYLTRNIYGWSWLWGRPMADVIFAICLVLVVWKALETRRERSALRARLAAETDQSTDTADRAALARDQQLRLAPHPFLAVIVSCIGLGLGTFGLWYALARYDLPTGLMPEIGAAAVAVPCLFFLPKDVYRYILYRRTRGRARRALDDLPPAAEPGGAADGGGMLVAVAAGSPLADPSEGRRSEHQLEERVRPAPDAVASNFAPGVVERSWGRNGQYRREAIAMGWLLGLVVVCKLVGFEYGTAAFVFCYFLVSSRRTLRTLASRVVVGAIASVAMFYVVHQLLILTHVLFYPVIRF